MSDVAALNSYIYIRQEFDGFGGRTLSKLVGHGTAIKGNAGTEFDKRINIISDNCFTKPGTMSRKSTS